MLAKAVYQPAQMLNVPASSRASSLPQGWVVYLKDYWSTTDVPLAPTHLA